MKYAIRLSHLPPVVLYVATTEPVDVVVRDLQLCQVGGLVHRVMNTVAWCKHAGWFCELVEDENTIVFTDTRDADYLITPVNGVWSTHLCK
jgi:hypothetical protein